MRVSQVDTSGTIRVPLKVLRSAGIEPGDEVELIEKPHEDDPTKKSLVIRSAEKKQSIFDPYLAVKEFHRKFGFADGASPKMPDVKTRRFRMNLIDEESSELEFALKAGDLTKAADAIADLLYVTYGTAVSLGIDIRPIIEEVHRANMQKEGGEYREDDGKLLKPEGWEEPKIAELIEEQQTDEEELPY